MVLLWSSFRFFWSSIVRIVSVLLGAFALPSVCEDEC